MKADDPVRARCAKTVFDRKWGTSVALEHGLSLVRNCLGGPQHTRAFIVDWGHGPTVDAVLTKWFKVVGTWPVHNKSNEWLRPSDVGPPAPAAGPQRKGTVAAAAKSGTVAATVEAGLDVGWSEERILEEVKRVHPETKYAVDVKTAHANFLWYRNRWTKRQKGGA